MIVPSIRDGLDAVAFIEAVRFGLWATLVAHRKGQLGHDFLRAWGRVQSALQGRLLGPEETRPLYKVMLEGALPNAILSGDLMAEALIAADPDRKDKITQALLGMKQVVEEAIGPEPVHPSTPPPSVGTHRKRSKKGAT